MPFDQDEASNCLCWWLHHISSSSASMSTSISSNKSVWLSCADAFVHFTLAKTCSWTNLNIKMDDWAQPVIKFGVSAGRNLVAQYPRVRCCANSVSEWQERCNLPALDLRIIWLYFGTEGGNGATSFIFYWGEIRRGGAERCSFVAPRAQIWRFINPEFVCRALFLKRYRNYNIQHCRSCREYQLEKE